MMADREKRRRLVWEIDKKLQEDGARPIVYHTRSTIAEPGDLNSFTASFHGNDD